MEAVRSMSSRKHSKTGTGEQDFTLRANRALGRADQAEKDLAILQEQLEELGETSDSSASDKSPAKQSSAKPKRKPKKAVLLKGGQQAGGQHVQGGGEATEQTGSEWQDPARVEKYEFVVAAQHAQKLTAVKELLTQQDAECVRYLIRLDAREKEGFAQQKANCRQKFMCILENQQGTADGPKGTLKVFTQHKFDGLVKRLSFLLSQFCSRSPSHALSRSSRSLSVSLFPLSCSRSLALSLFLSPVRLLALSFSLFLS